MTAKLLLPVPTNAILRLSVNVTVAAVVSGAPEPFNWQVERTGAWWLFEVESAAVPPECVAALPLLGKVTIVAPPRAPVPNRQTPKLTSDQVSSSVGAIPAYASTVSDDD